MVLVTEPSGRDVLLAIGAGFYGIDITIGLHMLVSVENSMDNLGMMSRTLLNP